MEAATTIIDRRRASAREGMARCRAKQKKEKKEERAAERRIRELDLRRARARERKARWRAKQKKDATATAAAAAAARRGHGTDNAETFPSNRVSVLEGLFSTTNTISNGSILHSRSECEGGVTGSVNLMRKNDDAGEKGQLVAIMRRNGGGRRSARIMMVNVTWYHGVGMRSKFAMTEDRDREGLESAMKLMRPLLLNDDDEVAVGGYDDMMEPTNLGFKLVGLVNSREICCTVIMPTLSLESCCYSDFLSHNHSIIQFAKEIFEDLFCNPIRTPWSEGNGIVISADSCYGNPITINIHRPSLLRHNYGLNSDKAVNFNRDAYRASYGTGGGLKTLGIPKRQVEC